MPADLLMLLVHRSGGLPTGLFVGGLQFIIVLVRRLSVILAMCPAQFHFNDAIGHEKILAHLLDFSLNLSRARSSFF